MPDVKLRFTISDDGTVKVLEDVAGKTKQVGEEAEKSSKKITTMGRDATDAAQVIDKGFERIRTAAIATVAAVGAGSLAFAKYAVDQASEFQLLETRLLGLTGSAEQARAKMAQALDIASRTPFEVARVVEAEAILAAFGETSGDTLVAVADLAAFMQRDIVEAAGTFGRALAGGAGAADTFRENGILAIIKANQELKGDFRELTDLTLPEFREAMLDTFQGGQIEGSAERLSKTFSGMVSNIGDAYSRMAAEVGTIVVHNERIRESSRQIIDEFDDMREASQDPAFRAFWSDVVELAGDAAVAVAGFGEEVIAQFAVWQLFRDDQLGITDVLKAYGENALGSGSAFRDLLRRYNETKSEIELTGGETWLGTVVVPDAEKADEVVNKLGGTVDAVKAKVEGFNPIELGLDEFSRQIKLAQGGLYGPEVAAQFEEIRAQAELVPGAINDWTDSIEQAQVAAVNLGDVLSDSLVSAVDGLITRGDFNLGDVLESTGKAAMSRMVAAMIKEKLGFDATFKANFLEYLPGIAGQGADAISRSFGAGLQSMASQASNAGQVISGALTAGGAVYDTGYGMSLSSDYGYMTDAATGQAVAVSGGTGLENTGQSSNAVGGAATASGWAAAAIAAGMAIGGYARAQSRISQDWYRSEGELRREAGNAPFEALGLGGLDWLNQYTPIYQLASWLANPPNRDQATRGVLADAYWEAGLFPGMFLAKEPPSRFRQYLPGGQGLIGPREIAQMSDREKEALGIVSTPRVSPFGGAYAGAESALAIAFNLDPRQAQANLGVRATGLGLTEEQYIRELRAVAEASGGLAGFISETTESFLNSAINSSKDRAGSAIAGAFGVDDSSTLKADQARYNEVIRGAITLFEDDIPRGVDAVAIAFGNMEKVGVATVLNLEAFNEELERQARIATTLQGGIAGAGQSAITALLTGGDPTAAFRSGLLNSVTGGIATNLVTSLFENGGAFGSGLTEAILSGDPAKLEQALSGAGGALELLTNAAEGFVPIVQTLVDTLEDGADALGPRSGYADQRASLADRVRQARIAAMSPSQQQAYYQRQLAIGGDSLGFLLEDGMISDAERPDFNYAIDQYSNSAFSLLGMAGNYATGSRQQRALQQQAFAALDVAQSALSIAAESATMQDVRVVTMYVADLRISPEAANNLHVG